MNAPDQSIGIKSGRATFTARIRSGIKKARTPKSIRLPEFDHAVRHVTILFEVEFASWVIFRQFFQ